MKGWGEKATTRFAHCFAHWVVTWSMAKTSLTLYSTHGLVFEKKKTVLLSLTHSINYCSRQRDFLRKYMSIDRNSLNLRAVRNSSFPAPFSPLQTIISSNG